ncbi:ICOS ligand-like [Scyliorhinus torazame]|uniref:ICOS ligand-like n=1 Tax=Scyliorhinus torazame TaxID=75743 RepID=UPI003B5B3A5F
MDPGCRPRFRGTRLLPVLFECGLILCWGTGHLSTIAVSGIVGESALLPCENSTLENHANDGIRVYWQRVDQYIHAFYSGKEHANQNYSNRVKLFTDKFKDGNFSLLLSNLRVSDEAEYTCVIQMKQPTEYKVVLIVSVTLQVAAHYTEPVLAVEAGQTDLGHGALVKVICSSWGGYPEPTIHWATMNTLNENRTVKNLVHCSKSELCNVTSVVWIEAKSNFVSCSIYNAKLQENKTATVHWNSSQGSQTKITLHVSDPHHGWIIPVVLVTVTIAVSLAVYILMKARPLLNKERCHIENGHGNAQIQLLNEGLETKNV